MSSVKYIEISLLVKAIKQPNTNFFPSKLSILLLINLSKISLTFICILSNKNLTYSTPPPYLKIYKFNYRFFKR